MFDRAIKFRAWDKEEKMMFDFDLDDIFEDGKKNTEDQSYADYMKGTIIMQYTGLIDKNGKEIYDGDIFTDKKWYVVKAKIEFENGMFGWWSDGREEFIPLNDCKEIEVIGNIYENPELLKNN